MFGALYNSIYGKIVLFLVENSTILKVLILLKISTENSTIWKIVVFSIKNCTILKTAFLIKIVLFCKSEHLLLF